MNTERESLFDAQESLARVSIACDLIFPDLERAIGGAHTGVWREWVEAVTEAAAIVSALPEQRKSEWRVWREQAEREHELGRDV